MLACAWYHVSEAGQLLLAVADGCGRSVSACGRLRAPDNTLQTPVGACGRNSHNSAFLFLLYPPSHCPLFQRGSVSSEKQLYFLPAPNSLVPSLHSRSDSVSCWMFPVGWIAIRCMNRCIRCTFGFRLLHPVKELPYGNHFCRVNRVVVIL